MFSIRALGQDKPEFNPICSGISYGFWDKELVFELTSELIETPLRISFYIKSSPNKKDHEFEVGDIDSNKLDITFHNPSKSGSSGLKLPTSILNVGDDLLGFMFQVEPIHNSNCYKLSYEFYNGKFPNNLKGNN